MPWYTGWWSPYWYWSIALTTGGGRVICQPQHNIAYIFSLMPIHSIPCDTYYLEHIRVDLKTGQVCLVYSFILKRSRLHIILHVSISYGPEGLDQSRFLLSVCWWETITDIMGTRFNSMVKIFRSSFIPWGAVSTAESWLAWVIHLLLSKLDADMGHTSIVCVKVF